MRKGAGACSIPSTSDTGGTGGTGIRPHCCRLRGRDVRKDSSLGPSSPDIQAGGGGPQSSSQGRG